MNRNIVEGKYLQAAGRSLQAHARRIGDTFALLVGRRLVVKGVVRVLEGMRQEGAPRRRIEPGAA